MKNTVGFVAVVVALLVFVVAGAKAQTVRPLTVNEAVAWGGATHAVTLDVADLTTTNGNTAQTFSVPVLAKQGASVVAYTLETAFQDTAPVTNNTLALTVGDGSTADLFLTSTEMCVDGTEVYLKFPEAVYNSTGQATNVTLAARSKVYTADGNMVLTVTPKAANGVSEMDTGKVTLYVRILDAVKRLR